MKLLMLTLLLLTAGCAIRRPVQAMYCNQRSADGKHCLAWATHPYPCVSTPAGSCTESTK